MNNTRLTKAPAEQSGVSIIICCYNSTPRIKSTLDHLARQTIIGSYPLELIIIDNASTDDLSGVVQEYWRYLGNPYPLRLIVEKIPGLSFARRRGVLNAMYNYGVFCDDDNWLANDYLQRVIDVFNCNPSIGVIGGASTPVLQQDPPPWFYSKCSFYAVGIQGEKTGDITQRHFLWGAGMAFRLDVLRSIYLADVNPLLSDREKKVLSYGGDGEICVWFILLGYRLFYDSELLFQHFIPKARLTHEYYESFFNCPYPEMWTFYEHYLNIRPRLISKVPFRFYLSPVYSIYKIKSILFFLFHWKKSLQTFRIINQIRKA
jgi:glycosyltransferase involved in cell wall biosynthesis